MVFKSFSFEARKREKSFVYISVPGYLRNHKMLCFFPPPFSGALHRGAALGRQLAGQVALARQNRAPWRLVRRPHIPDARAAATPPPETPNAATSP